MLPLLAPLVVPALEGAGLYAGGLAVQYIHDQMSTPLRTPANNVPSTADRLKNLGSRNKPSPLSDNSKTILAKKKNLAGLASGLSAGLALGAGVIGTAVTSSAHKAQTLSDTSKQANDAQKALQGDSHFLNNQVNLKQSLDYAIDAINAQTVALFQAISPISMHLASLVTAVNASTDAILGLDPTVNLPELSPVVNVPETPAPVVNVAPAPVPETVVNVAPAVPNIEVNVPTAPAPTINVEAPVIPDYTSQLDRMADSADAVKEHHDYLKQPQTIKDMDGNNMIETAPRDLKNIKNASIAREKTDTNNFDVDDSDFPLMDFLPVLPFVGRESVYDPNFSSPSSNPFTHKNIT